MTSRFTAILLAVLLAVAIYPQVDAFTAGAGNIGTRKRSDGVESAEVRRTLIAFSLCYN